MLARGSIFALLIGLGIAVPAGAQQTPSNPSPPTVALDTQWRSPRTADTRSGPGPAPQPGPQDAGTPATSVSNENGQAAPLRPLDSTPRATIARVTKGPGTLPNEDARFGASMTLRLTPVA